MTIGAAPRPAEATFFKPNLTLNPITGGFITAEGMHFFSMFYKEPVESANWRVMSRGAQLPVVIVDDRTAEVLAKLLYWERTHCEESYNWAPLTEKFKKDGMDLQAGVLGIEVNEKCRHLFETETMESDAEDTTLEVEVIDDDKTKKKKKDNDNKEEGVHVNQSPMGSVTRILNHTASATAAKPPGQFGNATGNSLSSMSIEEREKLKEAWLSDQTPPKKPLKRVREVGDCLLFGHVEHDETHDETATRFEGAVAPDLQEIDELTQQMEKIQTEH